MAPTKQGEGSDGRWGRSFASMDPERQREVVGYVRPGPIATAPASRSAFPERGTRATRMDWLRVQPDRETGFEGSSSRRSR